MVGAVCEAMVRRIGVGAGTGQGSLGRLNTALYLEYRVDVELDLGDFFKVDVKLSWTRLANSHETDSIF